jgi:hypothetical protein
MRSPHPRLRCIRPRPILVAAGVVTLLVVVEAAVVVERINKTA